MIWSIVHWNISTDTSLLNVIITINLFIGFLCFLYMLSLYRLTSRRLLLRFWVWFILELQYISTSWFSYAQQPLVDVCCCVSGFGSWSFNTFLLPAAPSARAGTHFLFDNHSHNDQQDIHNHLHIYHALRHMIHANIGSQWGSSCLLTGSL
eukprot:383392_1